MTQFDVFVNPISAARQAYPFVIAMQSNFAYDTTEQIIAPLAPSDSLRNAVGRLTPSVDVNGKAYIALIPRLRAVPTRDLARSIGSAAQSRSDLLAAIDYLFFGL
jgi:toxin CcdB